MKFKVMAVIAVLCLMAAGYKQKNKMEISQEPFEAHPEWNEDNPDAFWE